MTIDKQVLGNRIRQLRNSQGISQQELGKALDKSHAAISDLELGKTDLGVSDLTKIAAFFKVSVSSFIVEPQTSYIQHRDKKNISPEEKKYADEMSNKFIELARELAKKKQDEKP